MILRLSRCIAPFLVLLWILALLLPSSSTSALAESAQTSIQNIPDPAALPSEEERDNYVKNRGNDVVHQVWSILRDFDSTWKDSVVASTPSGFLETLWHYTKVVFRALFMNTPASGGDGSRQDDEFVVRGDLKSAVETLETAAGFDDPDAIFLLGEMNFFGNFSHPRRPKQALKWYKKLADLDGNSTAQYLLGLMYATGIGGVEQSQAKALIYHNFAAEQGNVRSEMTLAFRHHSGISTTRDCDKAVQYYKRVADKAMQYWQSGPPGGHTLPRNSYRWAEVDGGVYGEGASASSSGPNARSDGTITTNLDDVLEYLSMRESSGDYAAALTLGKHYYDAPRGYRRNLRKAQRQFMKVARAYWLKDGKVNPKGPKGIEKVAGKAAAYIGRMFLRGEGMEQNFEKASTWFRRGIANADPFAQYHLGIMYRDGLGMPKNGGSAAIYLKEAAEQGLAVAQSALGVLFLDQGDIETAGRYFELAAGSGVTEAFYYLAELTSQGVGRDRNCGLATVYYKVVAEKAEFLHSSFPEANSAYERGDYERALIAAMMAAEQGYEHAQANVAYLLDRRTSVIPISSVPFFSSPSMGKRSKLLNNAAMALVYFTRSSKQANVDSLVKMGDYYLSGAGTENHEPNIEKATTCYTSAAEGHHSAQALWNLGWMHENGVGSVTQDFHMAKRYYDLAYEMNKEAYLPVKLALVKLRFRSWWNGVIGGKVNPIRDDEDEADKKRPKTLAEWIRKFLDSAEEMDAAEEAALLQQQGGEDMELDGIAFADPGMPGGDAEYAARQQEEGYPGEEWDEFDDGLVESLIIVALAGALALLVYARQVRQRGIEEERRRRLGQGQGQGQGQAQVNNDAANPQPPNQQPPQQQPQQNQGPGQGGGYFPQPGDPELNNWVVGGVGH